MEESPPVVHEPMKAAAARTSWLTLLVRLGLLLAVLAFLHYGGDWVRLWIEYHLGPFDGAAGQGAVAVATLVFIVFLALPFVPGMEIGLALMVMLGVRGIVIVYLATVVALSLSFALGWLIPPQAIVRLLGWLHLHRAQGFAARLAPLTPEQQLDLIVRSAPVRIIPFLLRHRYLAIALVFNLPGNALIGGGGGIGLLAGLSRLFHFPRYVLTVCLAITPVPLVLLGKALLPG
jgi:hypothetical protein